ncbi:Ldh family oxidoreductase [Actinophytocola oryzae]|uniref:Putative oxidoreductase n=1 Tax=Actinophytocola oryzae TaxID=502181 RepID=A0A4R7VQX7_9PSEU|nr:Ldh family oxidoreductase [Actinophytocola oryzae]TDV52170.1 putative oxidoreductase [Actinophytocola oryzae]
MLVPADELLDLATRILVTAGTPPEQAGVVAGSLVETNLMGHDSHGVRRLVRYVAEVHDGRIDPTATPEVEHVRPGAVVVHGKRAFGRLSAGRAVRALQDMDTGSGVAVIRECNHIGRVGEYVAALAERDLVAIAFGNTHPAVAPHGGRERRLGTNPLAWAAPRARGRPPIVMDWASSVVAEGKLGHARERGEPVAEGLIRDAEGRMSTNPNDFYAGGMLLPVGAHKGYGLSVLVELVGGLLGGVGISSMPGYSGDFGTVLLAFAIDAFQPPDEFRAHAEEFCRHLAATNTADGHDEVLVPGEPEERSRAERLRTGVPVPDTTWRELNALAEV